MAPQKINIKERVSDGEIDLSMSDLQDVPVKEIAVFKKAVSLDLSNNHLKNLPANFATLTHLTKLDLSKNQLTELPENFGDLVKLRHLDLYQNQLQYLPLSFNKLKALRWLDLKDNPLVPAVAKVAGPCLNTKECQQCAKDVVSFFTQVQEQISNDLESRQKHRQKQLEANQQKDMENKKNKKKEKPKQKKENGPIRETQPKPPSKKNKKSAAVEKHPKKPSSLFKLLLIFVLYIFVLLFVLTSVKFEYTRVIEERCVELFNTGTASLPPHIQVYAITAGGYVNYVHNKTGNFTQDAVNFVINTDNWINVYDSVNESIKTVLQKIKEQYKQYVS